MPDIRSSRDVIIRTGNLPAALRFYEGILGFAVAGRAVEEDASLPRCYLRDPFGLVFNLGRAPAATA